MGQSELSKYLDQIMIRSIVMQDKSGFMEGLIKAAYDNGMPVDNIPRFIMQLGTISFKKEPTGGENK